MLQCARADKTLSSNLNSLSDNITVALYSWWSIRRSARTEEPFQIRK